MAVMVFGVLAASGLAPAAWATSRTYDFTVTLPNFPDSGPLAGTVAAGSLSFDESLIPVSGFGSVNGPGLLTHFSFSWNGIAYDETTANTGSLGFGGWPFLGVAKPGELTSYVFGNDCQNPQMPGTCLVLSNTNDWRASQGVSIDPDSHVVTFESRFFYAFPGVVPGQFGIGPTSNAPNGPIRVALIPVPSSYGLFLPGLGLLLFMGWRGKN